MPAAFLNKNTAIFALILMSAYLVLPFSVQAADACTATVDPTSVIAGTSPTITIDVTNSGDTDVTYIKVTRPSDDFTLYNTGGIPSPWSGSHASTDVELSGGTISPGGSLSFSFGANVGSDEAVSADWLVEIFGSEFATCTGTLGTAITGGGDTTGPSLSQPSVSGITNSSAEIAWTTDESSDSTVDYGPTLSYGSTLNDATLVTSHSLTLTGLSADTTYYYTISSTDAAGNNSNASGYNFTTASASTTTATSTPTPTPTPTATATTASVATATPTATPFVDRVAPNIKLTTEIEDKYEQAPLLEGEASDSIGVTEVEYSIDGGANWLPVGEAEGLGTTETDFSFTPNIFKDGNYQILARALDKEGNIGESESVTIIIDRLPPRVGGNLVSLGPLALQPNADGSIITIPGLEQRISLSAVGGATSIDLLINESISSLGFNSQTGLWQGALNLRDPGRYSMRTRAIDGAENITERDLNEILVVPPGRVFDIVGKERIKEGKVTLFIQDSLTKLWSLWDAATFGQENPQNLLDGTYSFYIPPGTYYLTITDTGEPKLTSKIFTISETRPLVSDFTLQPRRTLSLGPINIPLPDIFSKKADVVFKSFGTRESSDPLLGEVLPRFSLPGTSEGISSSELLGERSIVSFINTWSPPAVEQVPILDKYYSQKPVSHVIIAVEETIPKITVFQRRGGYTSQILSDRDGELVEDYFITSLPKHLFVDRRGVVQKVVNGVLNQEELEELLRDI